MITLVACIVGGIVLCALGAAVYCVVLVRRGGEAD